MQTLEGWAQTGFAKYVPEILRTTLRVTPPLSPRALEYRPITIPDEVTFDFVQNHSDNPLACLSWLSSRNRRSSNTVYIVGLGLATSGKSFLLSSLFNNDFPKVTDRDVINQYTVTIDPKLSHVSNFKLVLLNTPCYEVPSNSIPYLRTIEHYFEQKNCAPNFILLIVRYCKAEPVVGNSELLRLLHDTRSELKNTIDSRNANVIVVLTHVSIKEAQSESFRDIVDEILIFVQMELGLPRIFAAIDLLKDENVLDTKSLFSMFWILPSGRLCWYSVLLCLQQCTKKNGHFLGETLFNDVIVSRIHSLQFRFATVPVSKVQDGTPVTLVANEREEEDIAYHFRSLFRCSTEDPQRRQKAKVLVKLLRNARYYSTKQLPKTHELRKLMFLMKYLSSCLGKEDIDIEMDVLKKSLALTPPTLKHIGIPVGCQFCFVTNRLKGQMIAQRDCSISAVGCYLPRNLNATETGTVLRKLQKVSRKEYSTLKRIDSRSESLNGTCFGAGSRRRSISWKYGQSRNYEQVALLYQKSLFKVALDVENSVPIERFQKSLERTLEQANGDCESEVWDIFFQEFGTHYVSEVEIGGSIKFYFARKCARKIFGAKMEGEVGNTGFMAAVFNVLTEVRSQARFRIQGGIAVRFGISFQEDLSAFEHWDRSVSDRFVPLYSTMKMERVTKLVRDEWKEMVDKAISWFLAKSKKLKRVPSVTQCTLY